MAGLLGFTPEALMGAPDWQDLSPEDRSYVVDQWAIEHKAASPSAAADEIRQFNQIVDEFRAAAAPSTMERMGGFIGGVAESIPRSLAAAATSLPAYSSEAGGNIGRAIAGASGGEFLRESPLTSRTMLSTGPTLQNLRNWGKRQIGGEKGAAFDRMNQKLDALRSTLLDGPDDPKTVKSLAQQAAVAAAGYHGDDPTGYLYAGAPDGLADPDNFAEAVKSERRPTVINSFGTRDADLRGMRTIHADPENLSLAAAFRETRNPSYFEELAKRLTMSDGELRKASVVYANAVPDQAEYEKAWGDLAPMRYVRGALYGQSESPIDTALSLSGVGGLFRGAKAAAAGPLTLSKLGRGALKSTVVEGVSGAASAIGADARVTGGEIAEQAAAEVLGEAGGAAGAYVAGRGLSRLVGTGQPGPAEPAADGSTAAPLPATPEPAPTAPPFAPEEPAPDPGTARADLELPTGEGEIDPSLLPGAPLTAPTPIDPAGTVPETPKALATQKQRVARGNQAGMIVPGATAATLPPELQPDENDLLVVTDTPDGAVIHALDVSREEVLASQANGTLMQTLGYATGQKPTTPDALAVTVRTPDGTEVSAEAVAPQDLPAAVAAAEAKADPQDVVNLETPNEVVSRRMQAFQDPLALTSEPAVAGDVVSDFGIRAQPPAAIPEELTENLPSVEEAMAAAPMATEAETLAKHRQIAKEIRAKFPKQKAKTPTTRPADIQEDPKWDLQAGQWRFTLPNGVVKYTSDKGLVEMIREDNAQRRAAAAAGQQPQPLSEEIADTLAAQDLAELKQAEAEARARAQQQPAKPKRQTKAQKAAAAEAEAKAKFLEGQAKILKRSMQARRGAGIPDHPLGAVDIFDHVQEFGKIYLPPPKERRGGDQDEVVSLVKRLPPRYMGIFSKRSGDAIDSVAQAMYELGHISDPYPSTLVDALQSAYDARVSGRKQAAQMQQEEKQVVKQGLAFQEQVVNPKPSTQADRTAVQGQDLRVGDELTVAGNSLKVTELDPDSGDLVLEDGAKFGIQRISEDTVLYVEDHDTGAQGAALAAWDFEPDVEPLALETQTPADVVAERQATAANERTQAARQAVEERRAAPLTGDSSNVGQGALFEEDSDLFSGPSAQSQAEAEAMAKAQQQTLEERIKGRKEAARIASERMMGELQGGGIELSTEEILRSDTQSRSERIEAWADRTIAEGRKRLNAGLDPELLAAYAVKGAALIARGVRDFATWSAEMVKEFGDAIRPHLQRIFDQANGTTEPDLRSVAAAGPSAPSLPPGYDINRFGIRMQADDRLRASWRARFSPALYQTFTEEGLAQDVRQWIADNGGLPGATSLFLDEASGLKDFERNALGQQLAIAWDLRAVRMERQGNIDGVHQAEAALESVSTKLETLATQAGQALRAFGLWSKLSPRGLIRATQRRVDAAREEHVSQTLATGSAGLSALVQWVNGNPDPATGQPTTPPPTDAQIADRVNREMGPKAPKQIKERVPRLVRKLREAQANGPLTRDSALDAWADAFQLPRMTPALAGEIRGMVAAVDAAPKGSWLRQRAMAKLMSRLALHEGMKSSDILTAFWYANILSGIGTQLVNISGNASHLFLKSAQQILTHHPREILPYVRGMLDGAIQGAKQGWMAFKDGEPTLRTEEKWERADVLEMLWQDNPNTLGRLIAKYGAASWGRYVFRGLTAMDAMFYTTAKEGRAWVDVSRSLAKGQSLEQALGYDVASFTAAQQQAASDLAAAGIPVPSTIQVDRRAHEILEARRSADVLASSRRFGAETTFNYEPQGTLGMVAQLINRFIAVRPEFRLVVPFTKIVANLTDKALDWTPYGLVRAGMGRHLTNTKDRRFTNQERQERIVSGAISLVGGAALYAIAKGNEDQDDETVPFMIYGMGPRDKARRDQMPEGWRPMTIKIGNRYISYAETPLNLMLGAIGGAMDLRRYGKRKDSDEPFARAQAVMGGMMNGVMRSGMLSGIGQLYDAARGQGKLSAFFNRSASGLIPMQGLMRNIAEVIDPVKLDTATFSGAMLQNLPVLRGEGQPMLNEFGEPVRLPGPWLVSRLVTSNTQSDPDAVWLGRNQLSLPGVDNDVVVGTFLTKADKARLRATGGSLEADRLQRAENAARVENGYLTPEERTAFIKRTGQLRRQAVRQLRQQTAGRQVDPKILKSQLEARVQAANRIAMRQLLGLAPK